MFCNRIMLVSIVSAISMFTYLTIVDYNTPDTVAKQVEDETVSQREKYDWAADQYENCVYGIDNIETRNNCQKIFKEQIELLRADNHEAKGNIQ